MKIIKRLKLSVQQHYENNKEAKVECTAAL